MSIDSGPAKELENVGMNDNVNWEGLYNSKEYSELVKTKRKFVIPALVFFTIYYTSLLIIQGYFPEIASKAVIGSFNIGYLYALSQIPVAWILCFLFIKYSQKRIDPLKQKVIEKSSRS
ncbi:DUF485 domain-containing protein [bacterium LRH843]|nr:DUF485 domain-containing protein [bacterium LRH843]